MGCLPAGLQPAVHAAESAGKIRSPLLLPQLPPLRTPERDAQGQGLERVGTVKAAKPRFEGHHQPNVRCGYNDESDPRRWPRDQCAQPITARRLHFHWYYYEDGLYQERASKRASSGIPQPRSSSRSCGPTHRLDRDPALQARRTANRHLPRPRVAASFDRWPTTSSPLLQASQPLAHRRPPTSRYTTFRSFMENFGAGGNPAALDKFARRPSRPVSRPASQRGGWGPGDPARRGKPAIRETGEGSRLRQRYVLRLDPSRGVATFTVPIRLRSRQVLRVQKRRRDVRRCPTIQRHDGLGTPALGRPVRPVRQRGYPFMAPSATTLPRSQTALARCRKRLEQRRPRNASCRSTAGTNGPRGATSSPYAAGMKYLKAVRDVLS